jgi:L-ascorbate metabolism protein UlaG (beta-lactamase superfamily)
VASFSTKIRWLGIAAFEITSDKGTKIFVDPNLSDNPWAPFSVDQVDSADLVLVSHGAVDHGIDDAIIIAKKTGAYIQVDETLWTYAAIKGLPTAQMKNVVVGEVEETRGIKVRNVAANHTPSPFPGQCLGFIIQTESGLTIYHTGDTAISYYFKLIGELYHPNIMLINAAKTRSKKYPGMSIPMSFYEAALAAQWVKCDTIIPMHYDPDLEDTDALGRQLKEIAPDCRLVVLKPGASYDRA